MTREEESAHTVSERLVRKVDDVTSALERLADVLAEEDELGVLLQRVCQQAVHAIPEANLASVSLMHEHDPGSIGETVAVTDDRAIEIDKAQYSAGEGPSVDAARSRQVVRVSVAQAGDRWPEFTAVAGGAAVGSYLSAPLFIDREYHGSLNLYAHAAHGFDKLDAALLDLYTTAAEAALRTARRYLRARERVVQLREALTHRAVIDQAKGVLMAARRISADEAFALLVEKSQQENIRVRAVAERFIADVVG